MEGESKKKITCPTKDTKWGQYGWRWKEGVGEGRVLWRGWGGESPDATLEREGWPPGQWKEAWCPLEFLSLSRVGCLGWAGLSYWGRAPSCPSNITLNREMLKTPTLGSELQHRSPFSPSPFDIVLEGLTKAIRQENKLNNIQVEKEKKVSVCRWYDSICIVLKTKQLELGN